MSLQNNSDKLFTVFFILLAASKVHNYISTFFDDFKQRLMDDHGFNAFGYIINE